MSTLRVSKSTLLLIAIIAVIAIGFIMIVTIKSEPKVETVTYNGFEFLHINGLWRTTWERDGQPYELDFRFNPSQVEHIKVEGSTDIRFQQQTLYLTFDPSDELNNDNAYVALAAVELSSKLVQPFERDVFASCTRNETKDCADRPIITCENTNSSVVYLKQSEEAKIILDGNCVTFYGRGDELVKAADRALFEWLNIMSSK